MVLAMQYFPVFLTISSAAIQQLQRSHEIETVILLGNRAVCPMALAVGAKDFGYSSKRCRLTRTNRYRSTLSRPQVPYNQHLSSVSYACMTVAEDSGLGNGSLRWRTARNSSKSSSVQWRRFSSVNFQSCRPRWWSACSAELPAHAPAAEARCRQARLPSSSGCRPSPAFTLEPRKKKFCEPCWKRAARTVRASRSLS